MIVALLILDISLPRQLSENDSAPDATMAVAIVCVGCSWTVADSTIQLLLLAATALRCRVSRGRLHAQGKRVLLTCESDLSQRLAAIIIFMRPRRVVIAPLTKLDHSDRDQHHHLHLV